MRHIALTTALIATTATPLAAENRIDGLSPDAPELAPYGDLSVGVRRFDFVNPDQVDILAIDPEAEAPDALPPLRPAPDGRDVVSRRGRRDGATPRSTPSFATA